jgi:hypothetical protein
MRAKRDVAWPIVSCGPSSVELARPAQLFARDQPVALPIVDRPSNAVLDEVFDQLCDGMLPPQYFLISPSTW